MLKQRKLLCMTLIGVYMDFLSSNTNLTTVTHPREHQRLCFTKYHTLGNAIVLFPILMTGFLDLRAIDLTPPPTLLLHLHTGHSPDSMFLI